MDKGTMLKIAALIGEWDRETDYDRRLELQGQVLNTIDVEIADEAEMGGWFTEYDKARDGKPSSSIGESVIPQRYLDVLYFPENSDSGIPEPYRWNDFLNIAGGNTEYAMSLVDRCTWQRPETLCDEDEREGEIVCVGGEYVLTGGEDFLESMARRLWEELADVCIADDECIDSAFYGFPAGTHREEIWHWFEDAFAEQGITVHDLMYPDDIETVFALLSLMGETPREEAVSAADGRDSVSLSSEAKDAHAAKDSLDRSQGGKQPERRPER